MTTSLYSPTEQDRADWQRLYRGYADYYGKPMSEEILDTVWGWIHAPDEPFYCRLARSSAGEAIGLMHYRAMPSPLRGTRIGFLDDLFVDPAHRGSGTVDTMLEALGEEARRQGWPLVRWITREHNYRARAVYDRCARHTDWQTYELTVTAAD
ncbi:GNAT family N-acetyltransferase [Halomonas campisalis]|uniref:GNAT family N-acetyltransferase n=1 Tax=Billgrantia campisalis TaxID=74661 RepID=A0ABS9P636_9GAMM|nr:GNAT family N-acetyltransferase [Halomonas campisalis]MCG6657238.1 GNAT family N-acetyltransferase [Halomonas campisalis]MDR5862423.1 GNAT family N-acetyltransferase [Halomonas campisalis]